MFSTISQAFLQDYYLAASGQTKKSTKKVPSKDAYSSVSSFPSKGSVYRGKKTA
jgi:hypothetical protein